MALPRKYIKCVGCFGFSPKFQMQQVSPTTRSHLVSVLLSPYTKMEDNNHCSMSVYLRSQREILLWELDYNINRPTTYNALMHRTEQNWNWRFDDVIVISESWRWKSILFTYFCMLYSEKFVDDLNNIRRLETTIVIHLGLAWQAKMCWCKSSIGFNSRNLKHRW